MYTYKATFFLGIILIGVISLLITFPIVSASGEVPWKDQGPEWYYDNLDATDRQKIRQAIDYCVPRDELINEIHLGFAVAPASPIGINFRGVYEPSITAREYNTTKAKELLTEVFEYEYNTSGEGTNETSKVTNVPYFYFTLISRIENTARSQWAALISFSLNQIGIDTIIKWWNWDNIMPRLFLDPVGTGFDYENDGYDCSISPIEFPTSPDPTYKDYYDKTAFPPGKNYYWIEDGPATSGKWVHEAYPNITALWNDLYVELDPNKRAVMLKEYQQWCYDHVPTCIIRQEMGFWGLDVNLQGFDLYHGTQQQICNWTGIGSTAVIVQSGDFVDFNPLLSNSYYDKIIFSNTHVSLARRRGDYNLSHVYPWLAKNWTHTTDSKTWTVNLRQGNKWSDGQDITADDVVFTYHSILNESLTIPRKGTLLKILGNGSNAITKGIGEYQVIFTLSEVYAYTETVLFNVPILPEHQMSQIDLTSWKSDGTNTGPISVVASGPYVRQQYTKPNIVEIRINSYYNAITMGHNPYAVGGGNWIPNPTITNVTFEVVKSGTTAVTGIINGTYDVLDSQIGIKADAQKVNNSVNCQLLAFYKWGYFEMGLNHYSPIWGMNPHDPREMYPPKSFNFASEISLLVSNPIILLSLFGTSLVTGGFIALLVERFKNGLKSINIEEK